MNVIHHGASDGVTGSCHELVDGQCRILVDCGIYQGEERPHSLDVDFDVKSLQALLITHAHIDHIGRIPWLLAAGYYGPIYASEATAQLIPIMLDDGLKIQLGLNRHQRARFLDVVRARIRPIPYGCWVQLAQVIGPPVKFRFQPAGHILGSSIIEVELGSGQRVVFSGDVGRYNSSLLPDPAVIPCADLLVLESTYGDKTHDQAAEREQVLRQMVERSLENGGAILIPAFSVGRTQEILFDLENIIASTPLNGRWHELPIVVDSPLADKVTSQYQQYQRLWSKEAKERLDAHRQPMAFESLARIASHEQHLTLVQRLLSTNEPVIVIASSGMCTGGRIMNYLKALLPVRETDVVLAGYQARGTLGAQLQSGCEQVEIDGEQIAVNAAVHTLGGYSAHADADDLVKFVGNMTQLPGKVRLVHGEEHAQRGLASRLQHAFSGLSVELGCESVKGM
ncbi:MBL fold metallo-hydrolase [Thaumasiovibrio sp. DFM-14]|uniref:MBL fold metallo-hydrolase n=1 Tax=Thaumasiovibrio sp. DFM-14 TaxID=3384792 RepID=UPI0039A28608